MNNFAAYFAKIKPHYPTKRIVYSLQFTSILLLILLQGHGHPVFENTILNLGYHFFAFLVTIAVWVTLVFSVAVITLKVLKEPPSWLIIGFLVITLLTVCYGRMQFDDYLLENPVLDQHHGGSP